MRVVHGDSHAFVKVSLQPPEWWLKAFLLPLVQFGRPKEALQAIAFCNGDRFIIPQTLLTFIQLTGNLAIH
ncbi:hypothetical protein BK142_10855 [Paenibacillus glucanolyticus]|nr:hypothetical protein BK142_10855 [Paenibacillus glucanolyticus]